MASRVITGSMIKPWRFPHRQGRVYTRNGFRRRVVSRMRREGFTLRETEKLCELYFGDADLRRHQDEDGVFRNSRRFRLHAMSRKRLKFDRKNPTFELVIRSGLFYVFVDERGGVRGFVSPWRWKPLI